MVPDTAFGILGALSGPILTTNTSPDYVTILSRLPHVLAWNWLNLFIFDLANQRDPDAPGEDAINKPWRPIPAGLITTLQMRRVLLAALPLVLAINYHLGAWQETALIFILTWMYNDLKGGEDFLSRNAILSVGFACYNGGSLRVACGSDCEIHPFGLRWVLMIAGIILCTMQIQDLKDVAGDRVRNRQTIPIVLGDRVGRWTIALPVFVWSVVCPLFLQAGLVSLAFTIGLGAYIAGRVLWMRSQRADRVSWYVWSGWLVHLYALPLVKYVAVALDLPWL